MEFVICFKDCAELLMLCKVLLSTLQQGYQRKSGIKKKSWLYSRQMKVIHPHLVAILFGFFQDFKKKKIIFPFLTSDFLYQPLPWLGSRPSFLELYQFSSFVSSNHSSTLHLPWQEEEMAAPFLHACQCKILQRCSWNLLFPDLAPSIILLSVFNLSISTYSTLPTNAPLF